MEHGALIEYLGGPDRVAEALSCHRTRVVRWRTHGIPAERFPAILALASKRGLRDLTADALFEGRAATLRRAASEPRNRRGRPTPEWHAMAIGMKALGLKAVEIGRAFEVDARSVQRVLRKVGK